jgi:hypothetical protein
MQKEKFIEAFSTYLQQGTGAVFIGAGVSVAAGYPTWRDLVREMAEELELDLEREPDLAGVVQFFLNRQGKIRTRLTNIIQREIGKEHPIPNVLRTLGRLPIRHIWTTNYDTLTERAWREQRRQLDIKSEDGDLVHENQWAHGVLYKMHGTIDHPSKVVIAKSDYEGYRRKGSGFLQLLAGHLISKHMLFLGFSFTDPNVAHLFTVMRETFGDNPAEHFAIVRRPEKGTESDADRVFEYAKRRHNLWVEDLKNYGIQCVEVDEYEEIDSILEAVERRLAMNSVLVSGSFPDTRASEDAAQRLLIEKVAYGIGHLIIAGDYRFVSGFGLTVGSAALSGALEQLYRKDTPNLERSLYLRPFTQLIPEGADPQVYWQPYREDLVRQAGICIFIAGIKDAAEGGTAKRVTAEGVLREFEIIARLGRSPVPVGATGGAAAEIWRQIDKDYDRFFNTMPRNLFQALNDDGAGPEDLVKAVGRVLEWHKGAHARK